LAILYVRSGQTAPAQALLSQQAACRPIAEASLLQAQLAHAEPERAAELYQTARQRWPQSAPVWAAYAQWELAQGRTDSATKAAAQAFKLNPGNPEVRLLQAQLALLQGQPEQGLKLLAGLTQLASHPDYQRQYLLALVQTGQYQQALPALEAHLKRHPSERKAWEPVRQQMLAALKQRKGRF
jgi:predicted Zn-dependent protease